jgi:hypothetical protein
MVNKHGCTGPCDQGRQDCPHPQACEVGDDEPKFYGRDWAMDGLKAAVMVAVVVGAVSLLFGTVYERFGA